MDVTMRSNKGPEMRIAVVEHRGTAVAATWVDGVPKGIYEWPRMLAAPHREAGKTAVSTLGWSFGLTQPMHDQVVAALTDLQARIDLARIVTTED
jgi:HEAT repeat protein